MGSFVIVQQHEVGSWTAGEPRSGNSCWGLALDDQRLRIILAQQSSGTSERRRSGVGSYEDLKHGWKQQLFLDVNGLVMTNGSQRKQLSTMGREGCGMFAAGSDERARNAND